MAQERRESLPKVHPEASHRCNSFGKLWELGLCHVRGRKGLGHLSSQWPKGPQAKKHRSWQKSGKSEEGGLERKC